jgi:hypothetical protein
MEESTTVAAYSLIIMIGIIVFYAIVFWKVNEKAGHPGWTALIPIYNVYIHIKIAGRAGWWLILFFIPLVNVIVDIVINLDMAGNFGKSTGFGIGLAFLWFIFYPILAFGDAKYTGRPGQSSHLYDGTSAYRTG